MILKRPAAKIFKYKTCIFLTKKSKTLLFTTGFEGYLGQLSVIFRVSCQLNFRLFVSCQLKFWSFVSCQLPHPDPHFEP